MKTFKEKRKARKDKRKEEGKVSKRWDLLDIIIDLAELFGSGLVTSIRAAAKFLEHH